MANPVIVAVSNLLGPTTARAFARGGLAELHRVAARTQLWLGGAVAAFAASLIVLV